MWVCIIFRDRNYSKQSVVQALRFQIVIGKIQTVKIFIIIIVPIIINIIIIIISKCFVCTSIL